ncbi:MAG: hypothetical protein JNM72_11320 [Deltaproteobacteria bacterium]|nr:hypothetical protein [Deltaproteobacteria bacterium]
MASPPGRPYEPVDVGELNARCAEDSTPNLRALDDVLVSSRDELLALRCLCAVRGTLVIDMTAEPGGSDGALDSLAGLREVSGLRLLGDASAVDLRPLGRLATSTLRELTVSDLPLLETLDDLPLIQPNGELHLSGLPSLRALGPPGDSPMLSHLSLDALPLLEVGRLPPLGGRRAELELRGLPRLRSLRGLERVEAAATIVLDDLPALASLSGLTGLTEVDELLLSDLPALGSLRGLDALATADALELRQLSGLRRLDGLGGLDTVGTMVVSDNDDLRSFAGLAPGARIGTLEVERDPALTRLGDAGSPAVDHLTLSDLNALVEVDLHACGVIDRPCTVSMTRLPLLEALPRFGEGILSEMNLQELANLRSLAQRVRVDYRTDLRFIALDRLEHLDLIAEPPPSTTRLRVDSVELISLPALRDLRWDVPLVIAELRLRDMPNMVDLEGLVLPPLTLTVEDLPRLESLRGMDLAPEGIFAVQLRRLPVLRSLEGLDRQEILGTLELTDLPALTDMDALTLGTRVKAFRLTRTAVEHLNLPHASFRYTDTITAEDNPALRTADLDALTRYAYIRIVDSPLFEGFSTLPERSRFSRLYLQRLGALTNIEAFRGLDSISYVYLYDLPMLAVEDAAWICDITYTTCRVTP